MNKVSCFIAAYSKTNQEWLSETIESIRQQGIEPIVQFDEGVTHQRWSKAIKECQTEYIHLAHHDDRYRDGFYEETVAYLDSHPECAAVFTLDKIMDERGQILRQTMLPFEPMDSYDFEFVFREMVRLTKLDYSQYIVGNFLRCPSVVFRVSKVRHLEYPECDSASDTAMWFNVLANAGPIGIIPKWLFEYRESSHSDTQANIVNSVRRFDHIRALEYAYTLRPDLVDWNSYILLSKLTHFRKEFEEVDRVQKRADQAKDIKLIVVHEPPDHAGTGVVAAHRCRQENASEDGAFAYYVYPDPQHKIIRQGYTQGCPCVIAHPALFGQVVAQLKPKVIEFHHLLGWPENILEVE